MVGVKQKQFYSVRGSNVNHVAINITKAQLLFFHPKNTC